MSSVIYFYTHKNCVVNQFSVEVDVGVRHVSHVVADIFGML